MTEFSWQYGCTPPTGDYGPVTQNNLAAARLIFGNINVTDSGVIYWTDTTYTNFLDLRTAIPNDVSNPVDGLLEPTQAGGVVSIDTGAAINNGYLYLSDTTVQFDINGNPGNANATDRIVLRWSATAQTVRLTRLNGAIGATAALTQSSIVWDIPIARVELDGAGAFSALLDDRLLVNPPGTFMRLDSVQGDGTSGTISFSAIGGELFSSLRLIGIARSSAVGATDALTMTINGLGGIVYQTSRTDSVNAAVAVNTTLAAASWALGNCQTSILAALYTSGIDILFPNHNLARYVGSAINPNRLNMNGSLSRIGDGTAGATGIAQYVFHCHIAASGPITSIQLALGSGNFTDQTKLDLYGIV